MQKQDIGRKKYLQTPYKAGTRISRIYKNLSKPDLKKIYLENEQEKFHRREYTDGK